MGTRLGSFAALAVLAFAAVVAAGWDGPTGFSLERSPERSGEAAAEQPDDPREAPAPEQDRTEPGADQGNGVPAGGAVPWIVIAVVIGAGIAVLVAMRLHLLRRRRRLDGDRAARSGPIPQPGEELQEEDAEELDQRLDEALEELRRGEPRNAIVAIWLHLEHLLTGDRFRRRAAETPTEYAERARTTYLLDASALDELADLYREARFSEHPLAEADRDRAQRCLLRLRAGLREAAR